MSNQDDALDRTIQFVGAEAQARIRQLHVAIVGVGGLGTHVAQQLAFLRVGRISLIDAQDVKESSRNRYIGLRASDPIPGSRKVDVAERDILDIEPATEVSKVYDSFISATGFEAITQADYVFGCVDSDGARLVLNELCSAYERRYLDLATEIPPEDPMSFGGRVCAAWEGKGCLYCFGEIDRDEAQRALGGPDYQRDHERLYGVRAALLPGGGPAVVTLNGVVASLATTEFLLWAADVREPRRLLSYYGLRGVVTVRQDPPAANCYYCQSIVGQRDRAALDRYISSGVGSWLR